MQTASGEASVRGVIRGSAARMSRLAGPPGARVPGPAPPVPGLPPAQVVLGYCSAAEGRERADTRAARPRSDGRVQQGLDWRMREHIDPDPRREGRLAVAERVADDLEQTLVAMNQQTFAVLR